MKSGCDFKELKDLAKKIEAMGKQENIDKLYEECLKELAARFLSKVIKRTPVAKTQYKPIRDNNGKIVKFKKGAKKRTG